MSHVLIIENWQDRGDDIVRLVVGGGDTATLVRPYVGESLPPLQGYDGVVLSGGPMSIHERRRSEYAFLDAVLAYIRELIARSTPCLGICLGHQLLAHTLGGQVDRMATADVGIRSVRPQPNGQNPNPRAFETFVFHLDAVLALPPDCVQTFTSDGCAIEGFRHGSLPLQGVQFHPEVSSARALEVLTRWSASDETFPIHGDPMSFDDGAAAAVFSNLLADVLSQRCSI